LVDCFEVAGLGLLMEIFWKNVSATCTFGKAGL
jgi:hypothetical protein